MASKKEKKTPAKNTGKTSKPQKGISSIIGIFKGMFTYDESIFNLG